MAEAIQSLPNYWDKWKFILIMPGLKINFKIKFFKKINSFKKYNLKIVYYYGFQKTTKIGEKNIVWLEILRHNAKRAIEKISEICYAYPSYNSK